MDFICAPATFLVSLVSAIRNSGLKKVLFIDLLVLEKLGLGKWLHGVFSSGDYSFILYIVNDRNYFTYNHRSFTRFLTLYNQKHTMSRET